MSARLVSAVPVLRIYDAALARAFYLDFLGFSLDWEHRFAPDLPLYMQVSLGDVRLHLSEHYGDGTPGSAVYMETKGLRDYLSGLLAKQASFARPSPDDDPVTLTDPFGNMLRLASA